LYEQGENWAVLACGSNGYMNYRHQADVFHVYQSLLKRGFSKEHIILFAYDDIAYSPKNPFPGQVFNRPDGPDVYEGVTIDYYDYNVNPETYISVLKGDNKNGSLRKVLNSTENDNIFLYFVDHGIAGAIVFPDNKFLYADELEETFKFMKDKKMYKNIIFYLESCYSGSMFNNISPDLNVYSVTAASPSEQSLATYCYPQDYVNGQQMHTCLSNEFTSNWLDDSDSRIFFEENQQINYSNDEYSSHEQFIFTKDKTKNSHVQEYGDLSVGDLPITFFQSSKDTVIYNDIDKHDGRKKGEEKKKDEILFTIHCFKSCYYICLCRP
jgi:legumain